MYNASLFLFFFFLMTPPPPRSTLFPSPTLFRSRRQRGSPPPTALGLRCSGAEPIARSLPVSRPIPLAEPVPGPVPVADRSRRDRCHNLLVLEIGRAHV